MGLWEMYFMNVTGWSMHPGYLKEHGRNQPTLEDCAAIADEMVRLTEERQLWHGSEQSQPLDQD